jgi:hypothetical protein
MNSVQTNLVPEMASARMGSEMGEEILTSQRSTKKAWGERRTTTNIKKELSESEIEIEHNSELKMREDDSALYEESQIEEPIYKKEESES